MAMVVMTSAISHPTIPMRTSPGNAWGPPSASTQCPALDRLGHHRHSREDTEQVPDEWSASLQRLIAYCWRVSHTRPHELWPVQLRNATPSVFHQRHIGRVLRSSCNIRGRRLASSCGREPRPGRCPPLWPGDLRNDGGSVSAAGADRSEA